MRKNYNQKPNWLLKSCLVISFLSLILAFSVKAQERESIVLWDFNINIPESSTNWSQPVIPTSGNGQLNYDFTEAYSFAGSSVDLEGFSVSGNGGSFVPRGGSSQINNGSFFTISLSTLNFEQILFTYATQRTSTGFNSQSWEYSIDGGENFASLDLIDEIPSSFGLITIDLSAFEAVNNIDNLLLKCRLDGATSSSGNNRFDNIRFTGINTSDEEEEFFTPFTLNTVVLPFTEGFEECTTDFPVNWNVVTPVRSNLNTEPWLCSNFGQTGSGLRSNGFAEGAPRELDSWLIFPKFAVEQNTFVKFAFERRFDGMNPEFYVSSTFDGSEWDTNLWEELLVDFPAAAGSDDIWNNVSVDLSDYQDLNVVIAIRYISNSSGASRITVDDFDIRTLIDIPVSVSEIEFTEAVLSGNSSEPQSFNILETVTGEDLTLTASSSFELADAVDGTFGPTLSISAAELATETTVFVRFSPNSGFSGLVEGNISFSINPNVNIALSGLEQGTPLPLDYAEDFNNVNFFEQPNWQRFQEAGTQNWQITDQTRDTNRPFVAVMNGFAGGAQENTTWLISPPINMATEDDFILMTYDTRSFFNETLPALKLIVSTDYDRLADPTDEAYTWTEINGQFPTTTGVWTSTNDINLSAYKNEENLSVAFVYTSNPTDGAAEWMVDQFEILTTNEAPAPFLSTNNFSITDYHFGVLEPGTSSESRDISIVGQNFQSDITFTADAGIEISTDDVNFSSTLIVDANDIATSPNYTLKARMTANADAEVLAQAGGISISTEGLADQRFGYFNHTTIEKDFTFDVVTWNIEWFGDVANATTSNAQAQLDRVKTMILDLDADVYAFQEITNLEIWNQLVNELDGYAGVVSPETSRGAEFFEESQKLTYLFKTATVDTLRTRALLTGVGVTTDLPNYPGEDPTRFWASGRLPFMMDITTTIDGVEREISLINVHARSNGGGESSGNPRYAMRRYDVEVLYDSIEAYYSDRSIILLGDYNDDLDQTVADTGTATVPDSGESSFFKFMNDTENYRGTTAPLSEAGLRSFIFNENVIDHVTINKGLFDDHIVGAERVVIPYDLIPDYNNTASDHFPVEARFKLVAEEAPVLAITDVPSLEPITVAFATPFEALELPESIEVALENSTARLVSVTWNESDYNGSVAGTNTISGALILEEGILNPSDLTASIDVIVSEDFVTSVMEFEPLEVDLGTSFSDLQLPIEAQVTLESGEAATLDIIWNSSEYNPNTVGSNTLIGELQLTEGITNPSNLAASIEVNVNPDNIVSVANLDTIEVAFATSVEALELPSEVAVTLESGSSGLLEVIWNKSVYNGNIVGNYSLSGELQLLPGIGNPSELTAIIVVVVKGAVITEARALAPIEVEFGTAFEELELPSTVFVALQNGDTTLLSISWNDAGYDPSEANNYTIIGELVLTENVTNPDNIVASLQITVLEEVISSARNPQLDLALVNYPNPFTHRTTISFSTDKTGKVKVNILDMMGRTVSTILDKTLTPGQHSVDFDRNSLPAGVYIYQVETTEVSQMNRMLAK